MNCVEFLPHDLYQLQSSLHTIPSVTLLPRKSSVAFYCLLINSEEFILLFNSLPSYLSLPFPYFLRYLFSCLPSTLPCKIHRMYSMCSSLLDTKDCLLLLKNLIPLPRIPYPQPTDPVPPPFPALPGKLIFHGKYSYC